MRMCFLNRAVYLVLLMIFIQLDTALTKGADWPNFPHLRVIAGEFTTSKVPDVLNCSGSCDPEACEFVVERMDGAVECVFLVTFAMPFDTVPIVFATAKKEPESDCRTVCTNSDTSNRNITFVVSGDCYSITFLALAPCG